MMNLKNIITVSGGPRSLKFILDDNVDKKINLWLISSCPFDAMRANSGHPGIPLGMADILQYFPDFKFDPKTDWIRDRFVCW